MKRSQLVNARRWVAFLTVAAAGLVAGCGGSEPGQSPDSAPDSAPATASAPASAPVASDVAQPIPSTSADRPDPGDQSGSAPVKLANGTAPPQRTIGVGPNGFTPAGLSIAVGELVTFVAEQGGVFAVVVGPLDAATVSGGLVETFQFSEPGVYTIREELTGAITVL